MGVAKPLANYIGRVDANINTTACDSVLNGSIIGGAKIMEQTELQAAKLMLGMPRQVSYD